MTPNLRPDWIIGCFGLRIKTSPKVETLYSVHESELKKQPKTKKKTTQHWRARLPKIDRGAAFLYQKSSKEPL